MSLLDDFIMDCRKKEIPCFFDTIWGNFSRGMRDPRFSLFEIKDSSPQTNTVVDRKVSSNPGDNGEHTRYARRSMDQDLENSRRMMEEHTRFAQQSMDTANQAMQQHQQFVQQQIDFQMSQPPPTPPNF